MDEHMHRQTAGFAGSQDDPSDELGARLPRTAALLCRLHRDDQGGPQGFLLPNRPPPCTSHPSKLKARHFAGYLQGPALNTQQSCSDVLR